MEAACVCVIVHGGVTCVDVMAAAMHRCSHQGESKQTWQQNGKKCSNRCQSGALLLPLPLSTSISSLFNLSSWPVFATCIKDVMVSSFLSLSLSVSMTPQKVFQQSLVELLVSSQWAKTDVNRCTLVTFTFFFVPVNLRDKLSPLIL